MPEINTENDRVRVYKDTAGEWRWQRVDTTNHKILADSGEGYVNEDYARQAAVAYNVGCPLLVDE